MLKIIKRSLAIPFAFLLHTAVYGQPICHEYNIYSDRLDDLTRIPRVSKAVSAFSQISQVGNTYILDYNRLLFKKWAKYEEDSTGVAYASNLNFACSVNEDKESSVPTWGLFMLSDTFGLAFGVVYAFKKIPFFGKSLEVKYIDRIGLIESVTPIRADSSQFYMVKTKGYDGDRHRFPCLEVSRLHIYRVDTKLQVSKVLEEIINIDPEISRACLKENKATFYKGSYYAEAGSPFQIHIFKYGLSLTPIQETFVFDREKKVFVKKE